MLNDFVGKSRDELINEIIRLRMELRVKTTMHINAEAELADLKEKRKILR